MHNHKYSVDEYIFLSDFANGIANYELKGINDSVARTVYSAAFLKALKTIWEHAQDKLGGFLELELAISELEHIQSIPFFKRFMYRKYAQLAYNHVRDAEQSFYTRFISGGEGEGRIVGKVKL